MWGAITVLILWAADKNLLSKIWALLSSTSGKIAWNALTFYSNWKSTNDMIKDGYHVDEVFLWEKRETETREIDVTRIFRNHIQLQTFSIAKSIPFSNFVQLCCDPKSNFRDLDKSAQYELVVHYTFDRNKYVIVFDEQSGNGKIRFPLYTEQAIRGKDLKGTGAIISAVVTNSESVDEGIDIYSAIKKLAGPMDNFHTDTEFAVKKHHLQYVGEKMSLDGAFLKLMDLWGTTFVVRPEQHQIKLEK